MTGAAVAERHLTLVHDESKRAKALRRFNRDDQIFKAVTLTSALTVLVLLAGVMVALLHGSLPAWRAFGFGFFTSESWNPVTEKFGALPAIYGTLLTSFIAMLIGVPISLGIAIFLTEICPERLRRQHRHRHRAARRHPEHHLRHLGPVRVRALVPGACAAVADRYLRQHSRAQPAVRRSALRHRHADGRSHPRHHGAALHHLDHARGVRNRPAGAERGRLRHRLHPLGGDAPGGDSLYPGRHHRRRHARAWAARWARPWR